MTLKRLLPLCLLTITAAHAAPVTVLRDDMTYDVNADSTYVLNAETSLRIDEQQAIAQRGQMPIEYSASQQKLEILEAYTTTRDGTRVDVAPDKIADQQAPASTGAPMFSDAKMKVVVFPQVEVGSVLTVRYRLTQLTPALTGVFTGGTTFSRLADYKSGSFVVRAPVGMHLKFSSRDVTESVVKGNANGIREWRYTYGESAAVTTEPASVSPVDFSPYVAVSNLKDYPALAAAYMKGAEPAAKVTPAVQKLADEITSGITDKRAQAEALYRWVSRNIRYVAIYLGSGGLVPHNADDIISAAYGDCKDKATLLMALLNAKGIKATQALVHATNSYALPDTAVLRAFNHAINYLPEFNLFVDSTSGFAPFGVMVDGARGKQALVAAHAGKPAALMALPRGDAATDRIAIHVVATLAADGTVTGTSRIVPTGYFEPAFRGLLSSLPPAQLPQVGARLLAVAGQQGEAKLSFGELRDLATPAVLQAEFRTPNRFTLPGPGAISGAFGIRSLMEISDFTAYAQLLERKLEFPCLGAAYDEQVELTLPAEVKITNLPRGANLASPLGNYVSSYAVDQNRLTISRKLDLKYPRATCGNAESVEQRKLAAAIAQDVRSQILYQ
jgi:transglutaminase-like putative cysteine protease